MRWRVASSPRGAGGQGRGGKGLRSQRGSAGTGGDSWRVQGRGLEWGAGVGGPGKPLDWSLVGGGCGVIVLTVTDCPGSVSQFFIKLCPACAGAVCTGALGTFLYHLTPSMNLGLPCWWEGSAGGKQEPMGRLAGRGRKSFSPGYVLASMALADGAAG